jgi:hypothetical protein
VAVVERSKELYKVWLPVRRNMVREERFGIGARIDTLLLDLLETLRRASYIDTANKPTTLGTAIGILDSLRFFLQLAWEAKLIGNKPYEELAIAVEEIGRMTGGWRKGLLSKTPPGNSGERTG